jgi:hypothetical protein
MTLKNKPLIVTPTYEGKDYCLNKYLESIYKLKTDFILIDNSKEDNYYKKLLSMNLPVFRVHRGNNSREAITNAMNFARQYMLERDYTHMLVIESDLFPQEDTVNRLLHYDLPVVGSYYLLGITFKTACIFVMDYKKELKRMGTRLLTQEESFKIYKTGLQKTHGCGLGCTLIKRDIIKRFPFWVDKRMDTKFHDVYFYLDLWNSNVPVYVDTNHLIEHQPSNWNDVEDM